MHVLKMVLYASGSQTFSCQGPPNEIVTLASRPPFGIIQHNPIIGIINCMEQKCIFWSKNVMAMEYK